MLSLLTGDYMQLYSNKKLAGKRKESVNPFIKLEGVLEKHNQLLRKLAEREA